MQSQRFKSCIICVYTPEVSVYIPLAGHWYRISATEINACMMHLSMYSPLLPPPPQAQWGYNEGFDGKPLSYPGAFDILLMKQVGVLLLIQKPDVV